MKRTILGFILLVGVAHAGEQPPFRWNLHFYQATPNLDQAQAAKVGFGRKVKPSRMRTLEFFKKTLNKSMTPAKASAAFGEPDRKRGSGLLIYEYDLVDGGRVRLGFPGFDRLLYARHIKKGGQTEDIPLK